MRKRSLYFALTSANRSATGGSDMKSTLFCSTSVTWALLFLFSLTMILSTFASATSVAPASLTVAKLGLRSMVNVRGAATLLIMNGPVAGGGLFVASLSSGVLGGTGAANISPSTFSNVPLGPSKVMVMWPVLSSVVMPEMVWALPSA